MKKAQKILLICIACLSWHHVSGQYFDDTTFVGTWKMVPHINEDDPYFFLRCTEMVPNQVCITIRRDGTIKSRFSKNAKVWTDEEGECLSLSMGHISLFFPDTLANTRITMRFMYAHPNDPNKIKLTDYQEDTIYSLPQSCWYEVPNGTEPTFTVIDSLVENGGGICTQEGSVWRRILRTPDIQGRILRAPGSLEYLDIRCSPLTVRRDYFDIQYYHEGLEKILIEGFLIGKDNTLKRVRYEVLGGK
jgi:hypothetical protein